jgi:hypothetical protein
LFSNKRIGGRPASKTPSARGFFLERAMMFTVTSGTGLTEVVDSHSSARAALKQILALLGRKRNDVRVFDEKGRRRTPADLCRLAAQEVAMLDDDHG